MKGACTCKSGCLTRTCPCAPDACTSRCHPKSAACKNDGSKRQKKGASTSSAAPGDRHPRAAGVRFEPHQVDTDLEGEFIYLRMATATGVPLWLLAQVQELEEDRTAEEGCIEGIAAYFTIKILYIPGAQSSERVLDVGLALGNYNPLTDAPAGSWFLVAPEPDTSNSDNE